MIPMFCNACGKKAPNLYERAGLMVCWLCKASPEAR